MKKYILILLCSVSLLSTGCNYLSLVPEKDIETIESVFESKEKAWSWWMSLYSLMNYQLASFQFDYSHAGAGEFTASEIIYTTNGGKVTGLSVANGLQMPQNPYGSTWKGLYQVIRRANIFLENINNTPSMTNRERNQMIADTKAVKAFIYFELMRRYGPICLVPQNMPVDLEISEYQLPRQPIDLCVEEIVKLLDEAVTDIPTSNERPTQLENTFCLEGVLALKAKVLLYAASPLFNGNIIFKDFKNKNGVELISTTYDRNKWKLAAEATDAAIEACLEGGNRKLIEGEDTKNSPLLNVMYDLENVTYSKFNNPEFLIECKILGGITSYILPELSRDPEHKGGTGKGSMSPSMKIIYEYYTEYGLPIEYDKNWNYSARHGYNVESSYTYEGVLPLHNTNILNLHLRREPRFYANIAGDGMYYQRGKDVGTLSKNLLVVAYQGSIPWGSEYDIVRSDVWQNPNGYWLKKTIYSDFETPTYMNFTKNLTRAFIRVGELYLMQAEAWNEYLDAPNDKVYDAIDMVRKRAGIPDVRTSWKTYSTAPSMVETKKGMRDIIRREYNIELAFEGHRYWNIRRWMTAPKEMNDQPVGWNIIGKDAESFYNNWTGPRPVGRKNKFVSPRDYFEPFSSEEIQISGMKQNPGWINM